jgi:hypothetical protein
MKMGVGIGLINARWSIRDLNQEPWWIGFRFGLNRTF